MLHLHLRWDDAPTLTASRRRCQARRDLCIVSDAMSALLVHGSNFFLDRLLALVAQCAPSVEIHRDVASAPHERIDAFVCMRAPNDRLPAMPRLAFAFSPGAGIDGLVACKGLPAGLPLVRVVDPQQARRMAQYVALMVLAQWRGHDALRERQRTR